MLACVDRASKSRQLAVFVYVAASRASKSRPAAFYRRVAG